MSISIAYSYILMKSNELKSYLLFKNQTHYINKNRYMFIFLMYGNLWSILYNKTTNNTDSDK